MIVRGDEARVAYPLFQEENGGASPTSPLQFRIEPMKIERARGLNEEWHSRLPKLANYWNCFAYGAIFENRYYAVACWSDPVARLLNSRQMLELRRMAIAPDAPKNTASRMLAIMTRLIRLAYPSIKTLVSYQDTAVHTGTIYKAAGWKPVGFNRNGSWDRPNRFRQQAQSDAPKIRWEYLL